VKIYVGNLNYTTTESTLRDLFGQHGEVATVDIIMDRDTQRPRGFGFVEMPDSGQAQAAIAAINGSTVDMRTLNVNEARPREDRGGRGGGGGGYNRGGGGRW
jgi:cold-inducible RNA-binding protein